MRTKPPYPLRSCGCGDLRVTHGHLHLQYDDEGGSCGRLFDCCLAAIDKPSSTRQNVVQQPPNVRASWFRPTWVPYKTAPGGAFTLEPVSTTHILLPLVSSSNVDSATNQHSYRLSRTSLCYPSTSYFSSHSAHLQWRLLPLFPFRYTPEARRCHILVLARSVSQSGQLVTGFRVSVSTVLFLVSCGPCASYTLIASPGGRESEYDTC